MVINLKNNAYLEDIRFWIITFFIIRLIGITNAPLEVAHNWRQCLTLMVSRNFLEQGPNIFYPQIDIAGEKTGIMGSEFPIFNYLIYFFSQLLGYTHWYGRLINLVVSSFGIYYFYRIVEKIYNQKIAFSSSIVLLFSLWFAFSRKIMPDTFSIALVIIGFYYGYVYLTTGKFWSLLLYFGLVSLGILSKIPALALLGGIGSIAFIPNITLKRKIAAILVKCLSLGICIIWYFRWVPYLLNTYHYQLYFPKNLNEGWQEIRPLLPELFEKFYFAAFCSYIAFVFMLRGIYTFIRTSQNILKMALLLTTITFFVFILKTGSVFPLHSYYIIPFIPVMALWAGIGISQIPNKYSLIVLVLIAIESIANQQHDFFIKKNAYYQLELESIAAQKIPAGALIAINGGQSPQAMYFAHRKGWTIRDRDLQNKSLDSLAKLGAYYLIIDKKKNNKVLLNYKILYQDSTYCFYELNPKK